VLVGLAIDVFRSRQELVVDDPGKSPTGENALLRQQLIIAARAVKRPQFGAMELRLRDGETVSVFDNPQRRADKLCGKGADGGCDSFFYTTAGCMGVTGWGLELDGDGYYCEAAFKLGATVGGSCGNGDQGFLNDCDCNDEQGEMYYR
jgi:hypothetical protein